MITLKSKLRKGGSVVNGDSSGEPRKRASVRDQLLVKEVQEMEQTLPPTCKVWFDNPNELHNFKLTVSPDEGFWVGGHFTFHILITEDYNMVPPIVNCETKLWHPNISENGAVCLSLLRQSCLDGMGWAPTRKLKDLVWGLNSLFTDLLNFDDPLNMEASELYAKDKEAFYEKVRLYVTQYAKMATLRVCQCGRCHFCPLPGKFINCPTYPDMKPSNL